MNEAVENGSLRTIDGVARVYFDGYWIKRYDPPSDSLAYKKLLIQSLTRRLFNHMEHGINIPGRLLDKVRTAYEQENDPARKRVKGAMLAGALFNRAADIFTQLVELESCGVEIKQGNDLMHACGECLREALEYGKLVHHRNGDEGIDELWGEPFKAFIMSIEDFYHSRYVKIALTMRNIDEVAEHMITCLRNEPRYAGIEGLIRRYAETAKTKCETLRTDEAIFDVWTDFVVAGEKVLDFAPIDEAHSDASLHDLDSRHLLERGIRLIGHITRARTAMPKSSDHYRAVCQSYKKRIA